MQTTLTVQQQIKQAQKTGDFGRACDLAATLFTLTGRTHKQQHGHVPDAAIVPDLAFWPCCARRAEQAGRIFRQGGQEALPVVTERLRAANLWDFAQALESGVYSDLAF